MKVSIFAIVTLYFLNMILLFSQVTISTLTGLSVGSLMAARWGGAGAMLGISCAIMTFCTVELGRRQIVTVCGAWLGVEAP